MTREQVEKVLRRRPGRVARRDPADPGVVREDRRQGAGDAVDRARRAQGAPRRLTAHGRPTATPEPGGGRRPLSVSGGTPIRALGPDPAAGTATAPSSTLSRSVAVPSFVARDRAASSTLPDFTTVTWSVVGWFGSSPASRRVTMVPLRTRVGPPPTGTPARRPAPASRPRSRPGSNAAPSPRWARRRTPLTTALRASAGSDDALAVDPHAELASAAHRRCRPAGPRSPSPDPSPVGVATTLVGGAGATAAVTRTGADAASAGDHPEVRGRGHRGAAARRCRRPMPCRWRPASRPAAPTGSASRVTGADGTRPVPRTVVELPASTMSAVGTRGRRDRRRRGARAAAVVEVDRRRAVGGAAAAPRPRLALTEAVAATVEAATPAARGASTVSQDSEVPFWVARTDGAGDELAVRLAVPAPHRRAPALGEVQRRAAGGEQHRDVGAGAGGVHRVGVEPHRTVPAEAPLLAGPDRRRRGRAGPRRARRPRPGRRRRCG